MTREPMPSCDPGAIFPRDDPPQKAYAETVRAGDVSVRGRAPATSRRQRPAHSDGWAEARLGAADHRETQPGVEPFGGAGGYLQRTRAVATSASGGVLDEGAAHAATHLRGIDEQPV